ncbi:MAG: tetratricopeptide repeat protein, partial [Cyanobacteria bacterium J06627_28]
NSRGNTLRDLERYQEALDSYDRAIELQPDYHYAWNSRGNTLRDLERYQEALDSYDRAIELQPDYHYAWSNKGYVFYRLHRLQESIQCFVEVTKLNPDEKDAWNNQAYLRLVAYSYGLESPIVGKPLLIRQSQYLENNHDIDSINLEECRQSLSLIDKALQLDPEFAICLANKSFPCYYLAQYKNALQSCDTVLALDPENREQMNEVVYSNRGYILLALGALDEALQSFSSSLDIDLECSEAWLGHGTVLYALGRYSEAYESLNHALALQHPLAKAKLTLTQKHLQSQRKQ